MRTNFLQVLTLSSLLLFSCNDDSTEISEGVAVDGEFASDVKSSGGSSSGGSSNTGGEAGVVTAGEWNDLNNWDFWKNVLVSEDYKGMASYWGFYTNHRISLEVKNGSLPINNAKIELIKDGITVWTSRTDNEGKSELFIKLNELTQQVDINQYSIKINNVPIDQELKLYQDGVNTIQLNSAFNSNRVELCFIVDATGSMGDELHFLKEDLKSVINKVKTQDSGLDIYTSSVFYRDEGDAYVVKKKEFTSSLNESIDFIQEQSAGGGGDIPEAVHSALITGIEELQWSEDAKTRIAFLLLDAPPHYEQSVITQIQNSIKHAAAKGVKIIPITASGIDKETEFLMRFIAVGTNGTYTFITNHSGVGNDHIEPTIGEYQVEKLNELLVRLIQKYSN
ncbi:vWA domain-containing protein [Wenyingzhuangia sp. IMCC45574]